MSLAARSRAERPWAPRGRRAVCVSAANLYIATCGIGLSPAPTSSPLVNVIRYENGLHLAPAALALDVPRRQQAGFISHAHADHVATHELTYCTPSTAALLGVRWGPRRVQPLEFGRPLDVANGTRLTALPAGHVLGSAMLLVESGGERLLYTGDFRLVPSSTAEAIRLVPADILVMECTFGDPRFRFPRPLEVADELLSCVRKALAAERTPVIFAYALGKAQQVARLLSDAGIRVLQHPQIAAISRVYERLGTSPGAWGLYPGESLEGAALIMPPGRGAHRTIPLPRQRIEIAVSGWVLDPRMRRRLRADYYIPMSDHADFDELLECVATVGPRVVYCWHGLPQFVETLRQRGIDAHWLPGLRVAGVR